MIISFLKYFDYFVLLPMFARLPVQIAYRFCDLRGWVQSRMRSDSRRNARDNLRRALPELGSSEIKTLTLRYFQVKARDEMEAFWYSHPLPFLLRFVQIDGIDALRRARERGKGVLFFSGHLGSLGLCWTVVGKHAIPINIVARSTEPEENPLHPAARYYNRKKIAWIEEAIGRKFILTRRGNYPRIRELLKTGEVIMIAIDVLPDIVNPRRMVQIDFLRRSCWFADGIASLYQETEASLVQWTIHRNSQTGLQEIELRDVTDQVERQASKKEIVQKLADFLEEKIHAYPEHWHVWDSVQLYSEN